MGHEFHQLDGAAELARDLRRALTEETGAAGAVPDTGQALELLRRAADALRAVGKAALTVKGTLTQPYTAAPETSPWKQFMEKPAREAYNLGVEIRRALAAEPSGDTVQTPDVAALLADEWARRFRMAATAANSEGFHAVAAHLSELSELVRLPGRVEAIGRPLLGTDATEQGEARG